MLLVATLFRQCKYREVSLRLGKTVVLPLISSTSLQCFRMLGLNGSEAPFLDPGSRN